MGEGAPANDHKGMFTVAHLVTSFDRSLSVSVRLGQLRPATQVYYHFQLKKLLSAVGAFPAAELRAHHLVSVELGCHFVRALKRLYQWAADEELIPKNPFKKLKAPPIGQRTRVLSAAEFERLLAVCSPAFARYLRLANETAARPGELRELRWLSVRLEERVILLTNFKAKDKRKDGMKVRRIPLTPLAVLLLAELRAQRPDDGPDGFVFVGRGGKPLGPNALRCSMRTARRKAGLNTEGRERVVCYTLRHTRATDLTRKRVDSNTLAEIMGHTTTQMTRRYQHLSANDLNDVIDRADGRTT